MLGSDKVMQLSFVERWFSSGNFSTQVGAATLKYSNIFFTLLSNFLSSKRLGFLVIIALQWWTCANQLLIAVFVVHAWTCRPEFCCSLQPRLTKQNKKATSINCYLLTKRYPQALARFTVTRFRNDALLVELFLVDTTIYAEFSRPHQNAGKRWHSMKKQHWLTDIHKPTKCRWWWPRMKLKSKFLPIWNFCQIWHWPIGRNLDLSFIWGHHHLHLVGLWISVNQLHTSQLATPCWRDPIRSKQLSTVAIWLSVWTVSCHCPVKLST